MGSALTFQRDVHRTTTLASLVRPDEPLNILALAARMTLAPPLQVDETPYREIRAQLTEGGQGGSSEMSPRPRSEAEASHSLRAQLESTIARLLEGRRSVAVMTGGGLDSAGLLALTVAWARERGARVFAVTNDFGGAADDRPYMRLLEKRLECETLRIPPEAGARYLATIVSGVDAAPCPFPGAPMEIALMIHAREHGAECVLMGEGGDDLLDGNPRALARIARGRPIQAMRRARTLRGFGRQRVFDWVYRPILASWLPASARLVRAKRTKIEAPTWAGPMLLEYLRQRKQQVVDELRLALRHSATVGERDHERTRMNSEWLRHQEQSTAGIERCDPYRDRSLIATIATFAPEWMLAGSVRRGLFRRAVQDLLPAELVHRDDKAFFEPAFVRMLNAAGGLDGVRDLARVPNLVDLGLVEQTPFLEAFEAFVKTPMDGIAWMTIWPVLCVEQFLRQLKHNVERPNP